MLFYSGILASSSGRTSTSLIEPIHLAVSHSLVSPTIHTQSYEATGQRRGKNGRDQLQTSTANLGDYTHLQGPHQLFC